MVTATQILTAAKGVIEVGALTALAYDASAALNSDYSTNYQNTYCYPKDLLSVTNPIYMTFKFEKYVKRAISQQGTFTSDGTIRLPLPKQLHDNSTVQWDQQPLGAAIGSFVDSAAGAIGGQSVSSITDLASKISGAVIQGAAAAAADALSSTAGGKGASALTGIAANPFLTMLFKQTTFKTHNFSWTFAPSSEVESNDLMSILQTFKYHMLPGLNPNAGNILYNYPEIVRISINPNDKYLYKFKPCIIESFNIDYAPGNTPAFFKTQDAPTVIHVSLALKEIELWSKNDFLNTTSQPQIDLAAQNGNAGLTG